MKLSKGVSVYGFQITLGALFHYVQILIEAKREAHTEREQPVLAIKYLHSPSDVAQWLSIKPGGNGLTPG